MGHVATVGSRFTTLLLYYYFKTLLLYFFTTYLQITAYILTTQLDLVDGWTIEYLLYYYFTTLLLYHLLLKDLLTNYNLHTYYTIGLGGWMDHRICAPSPEFAENYEITRGEHLQTDTWNK